MSVSGHSRKTLAGASPGERTFCAAAHPADAYIETPRSPEVILNCTPIVLQHDVQDNI